ncbi:hypothetical protein N7603_01580 [Acholeplasma vituli]|uniref:Phospholipid/glycerol acyltransferase domain-containing protein n=1 Tax=Paracholeplasma vituli TaxID=69473 RepID=A0ABT2PUC2_9MOLU|nr:hypothetical protein [Paracholeplasma vituli]MCU0104343.1 hypothetical protein [Paracholeplasma vituli]
MRKVNRTPFNMDKRPVKERRVLMPIAWSLSFPTAWKRNLKINKVNMEGLKPPYLLLCTHHAFIDFKVTTVATFPKRLNWVVAIDGFLFGEWLLRSVGAICKRKFVNDIKLVKHIRYVLNDLKGIVALYPEARYTLIGTNAILPASLGKMCKMLGVPVVVLNMHGNYLSQPQWNLTQRKVPLMADMTQIIQQEELENLSVDEINERIQKAFVYDEYKWQKDNQIKIDFKDRMKNIHKVLYQCPSCFTEHQMNSDQNRIWCEACGKTYEQDEYGVLKATSGETEFTHIPDWYEFEREQVKKQILEGTYHIEDDVRIESLPNAKGFHVLGDGHLIHDVNGFRITGDFDPNFNLIREPLSLYGLHIEYNYKNHGDAIDISSLDNSFWIFPKTKKDIITKMHFGVEELYKLAKKKG